MGILLKKKQFAKKRCDKMEITNYDGEVNLHMENGETLTITGKDVIELIQFAKTFTDFIETNSIGKKEEILNI